MDEFDYEAEFKRLAATDPDFEAVRQSMRETIAEECPDKEDDFCYNHEIFVKGYRLVKLQSTTGSTRIYWNAVDAATLTRASRCSSRAGSSTA